METVYEFKITDLKNNYLGTIKVTTDGLCVVLWKSGEIMAFRGPAVIVFKSGRNEVHIQFDGKMIVNQFEYPRCRPMMTAIVNNFAKLVKTMVKPPFFELGIFCQSAQ